MITATGGWPEQENPHTTRINALIDYHKILASIEKQQCERKKFRPKRSFMPAVSFNENQFIRLFDMKCVFLNQYRLLIADNVQFYICIGSQTYWTSH